MEWNDEDLAHLMGNVGSYDAGEMLGQDYEVVELLGKGGQAEVYKVRNNKDGRIYVAKIFMGDEGDTQFKHEQSVFVALEGTETNPHIVHGHPATGTGTQKVLILDYLEGPTLREHLEADGPSVKLSKQVGRDVLNALQSIHERDIAHCDIKPTNIKLVDGRGAVLFDFSIAASEEADRSSAKTPAYAPPENGTTIRRDIFSVGVLMHELATGRRPQWARGGDKPVNVQDRVVRPPELSCHPGLMSCIEKALQYDPARRFNSARTFLAALQVRHLFDGCLRYLKHTVHRYPIRFTSVIILWVLSISIVFGVLHDKNVHLIQEVKELRTKEKTLSKELADYEVGELNKRLATFSLNPKQRLQECNQFLNDNHDDTATKKAQAVKEELKDYIETVEEGYEVREVIKVSAVECRLDEDVDAVEMKVRISISGEERESTGWIDLQETKTRVWRTSTWFEQKFAGWEPGSTVKIELKRDPSSWPGDELSCFDGEQKRSDNWSIAVLQPAPAGEIQWDGGSLRVEGGLDPKERIRGK